MTPDEVGHAPTSAARSGWLSVSSPVRVGVMLIAGTAAGLVVGLQAAWPFALLVGLDIAALVFSAWTWLMMASMNSSTTAAHATRQEPGGAQTDVLVLLASVANLIAVSYVLLAATSAKGSDQDLLAGLGVVSVVLSWFAVHTLFSLRYARLYYTGQPDGIAVNQKTRKPRYLDFAYFAFTIGMTFGVPDTDLETPAIRTTALRQALLAQLFGAAILAATINLVSGLASSSGG